MSKSKEYEKVIAEHAKFRRNFVIWIIMKDGRRYGEIMIRFSSRSKSSYVTVYMLPNERTDGDEISGYEHIRDIGNDCRAREGIAKILIRNREKLKAYYGIDIPANEDILRDIDGWEGFMRRAGYAVIRTM